MYIERMYDYNRATDMYEHTDTFSLIFNDDGCELVCALLSLGYKLGEYGMTIHHKDRDAGTAVIGIECEDNKGRAEYWAVRK